MMYPVDSLHSISLLSDFQPLQGHDALVHSSAMFFRFSRQKISRGTLSVTVVLTCEQERIITRQYRQVQFRKAGTRLISHRHRSHGAANVMTPRRDQPSNSGLLINKLPPY
ncbi:hypothetical protein VTK56DRAFT_7871 [Thermocarpiscus australiensis]